MIGSAADIAGRGTIDPLARVRQSLDSLLTRVGVRYKSGLVEFGRFRIHYLEYGEGPPVLLLHGAGPGAAIWFNQIAVLGKRFRVIAPDNPVSGLSDRAIPDRPMFDFAREYVLGFLDAMRLDKVSIAGLSLGGLAAVGVALEQPERVRRLALIAAAGLGKEVPALFRAMTVPPISWFAWRPSQIFLGYMHRALMAAEISRPEMIVLAQYAYYVATVPFHRTCLVSGLRWFASADGQRRVFGPEELAQLKMPTMLVWGVDDKVFPVAHALRARAAIPSSELHVLEGAGHAVPLERPQQVSGLLERFFTV